MTFQLYLHLKFYSTQNLDHTKVSIYSAIKEYQKKKKLFLMK